MSDEPTLLSVLAFWAAIIFMAFCLVMCGHSCTRDAIRDDAVKQGHAEYYLDANNERQWRWKTPQPKGEQP